MKTEPVKLPWWRKDALGWPIETFAGKPAKSAVRIICQNVHKVICKQNAERRHRADENLNNQKQTP